MLANRRTNLLFMDISLTCPQNLGRRWVKPVATSTRSSLLGRQECTIQSQPPREVSQELLKHILLLNLRQAVRQLVVRVHPLEQRSLFLDVLRKSLHLDGGVLILHAVAGRGDGSLLESVEEGPGIGDKMHRQECR